MQDVESMHIMAFGKEIFWGSSEMGNDKSEKENGQGDTAEDDHGVSPTSLSVCTRRKGAVGNDIPPHI